MSVFGSDLVNVWFSVGLQICRFLWTINPSQERTKLLKTMPSFQKKNKRIELVLKTIGTIYELSKNMDRTLTGWKERSGIVNVKNQELFFLHLMVI